MRRLLLVASAIVFVDTVLYAALTPLLPRYAEDLELSKAGAGALAGAYAAGALVGGLPGGVAAARLGARGAAVVGLAVVAAASVAFGLAGGPWELGTARFAQGLGSALAWAGALAWLVGATPRERRAQVLGSALAVAIAGAMLGPVLGAAAELAGAAPTFSAFAVAAAVLAGVALRLPAAPREPASFGAFRTGLEARGLLAGLWLMTLPSLLFGLLAVLVPLELSALGWGAVAIGALWLGAAAIEAAMNPLLGRYVDRNGARLPIRAALVASVGVSVALAGADSAFAITVLVLAGALAFGAMFTPGMSLISDGAEHAGIPQALAFGFMNAAWAVGNLVGPAGGGATAHAFGDATAYLLAGALCVVTLATIARYARAPGPATAPS